VLIHKDAGVALEAVLGMWGGNWFFGAETYNSYRGLLCCRCYVSPHGINA
jgi:hypothetical protein